MIFHGSHGIALSRGVRAHGLSRADGPLQPHCAEERGGLGRAEGDVLSVQSLRTIPGLVNVYSLRTGKSPFLIGKSTINGSFPIAMLVYQRVTPSNV